MASTIFSKDIPIIRRIGALFFLYLWRKLTSIFRHRNNTFERLVDNTPLLLMKDGKYLWNNMKAANISQEEFNSKVREKGIGQLAQVKVVVLETNGDFSVIQGDTIDPNLMRNVRLKN